MENAGPQGGVIIELLTFKAGNWRSSTGINRQLRGRQREGRWPVEQPSGVYKSTSTAEAVLQKGVVYVRLKGASEVGNSVETSV